MCVCVCVYIYNISVCACVFLEIFQALHAALTSKNISRGKEKEDIHTAHVKLVFICVARWRCWELYL